VYLIAHRGNVSGPRPELENSPKYLDDAIYKGYDVEVDVWYINNKLYLGHSAPQYEIEVDYLKNKHFWCHCKNTEALRFLLDEKVHCFFHQSDAVTLTSQGFIWTFPKKKIIKNSICVMPEYGYDGHLDYCLGICSDYIEEYHEKS
jgi:hypothetical protein